MSFILNIILNSYFPYILSLIISFILIYFHFIKKNYKSFLIVLIIFLILLFTNSTLLAYFQYKIWENHPFSKYLLPPYNPASYFLSYSYHHFYKNLIWRIIGGLFILILVQFLNKLFKKSLFYEEEYLIIPSSIILVDFPFNFLIFVSGLLIIMIIHLISFKKEKSKIFEKISLKDYWLFISVLFIILNIIIFKKQIFTSLMP